VRATDISEDVHYGLGVLLLCSLVSGYQCCEGTCCLHLQKGWTFYQKKI